MLSSLFSKPCPVLSRRKFVCTGQVFVQAQEEHLARLVESAERNNNAQLLQQAKSVRANLVRLVLKMLDEELKTLPQDHARSIFLTVEMAKLRAELNSA